MSESDGERAAFEAHWQRDIAGGRPLAEDLREGVYHDFAAGYRAGLAHARAERPDLHTLEVKDGDAVAVEYERRLSQEDVARVAQFLEEFVARRGWKNVGIMVLDDGAKVRVLRKADSETAGTE